MMMTSISPPNAEDKLGILHRTGSRYNRNRDVLGSARGNTLSSHLLATVGNEGRRSSDPLVGSAAVLNTPDLSPVDENQRRVVFLAPPTREDCAASGYHSDSAATFSKGKGQYASNAKAPAFERSDSRISKASQETTTTSSLSGGARTPFVLHRSLSVISTSNRSSSYEEELEERLGNLNVGAQLWKDRSTVERRRRLEVMEQMAQQEQGFQTMLENLHTQAEHKYERLKNRASVLMKRCEQLRGDRQLLERKLDHVTKNATCDRQVRDEQIAVLTKEIDRLRAENEAKLAADTSPVIETVKPLMKYNDSNMWCEHYETLLKIALKRIRELEECFQVISEQEAVGDEVSAAADGGTCIDYKSTSCPSLLPSAVASRIIQSMTRDSGHRMNTDSDSNVSPDVQLKEKSEGHPSIANGKHKSVAAERNLLENNHCLSNEPPRVQLRRQRTELTQNSNSPRQTPRDTKRPLSDIFPVLPARFRTPKAHVSNKKLCDSHSTTIVNKTVVNRSSTFLVPSSSVDSLTYCTSPKSNLAGGISAPTPTTTRVKARRVVSMPQMDILRRIGFHHPGGHNSTAAGGRRKTKSAKQFEFKSDDVIGRLNGLETLDDDEGTDDEQLSSYRSLDSRGEEDTSEMSSGSVLSLTTVDGTEFTSAWGMTSSGGMTSPGDRLPVQGKSSFSRLRERRNGLTDSSDVTLRAVVSRSKLDQIAKNIKTYLH